MEAINGNLINKEAVIYTKEKYRYECIISSVSDVFIEFLDKRTGKYNVLSINEISRIELINGDENE